MAEPDYYDLIGVPKQATLQEIRTKFRQKVLAEHPDKGGDPKKFQLLNKAYNVLTDQDKRKRYDATGSSEKSAEDEFIEGFGGGRLNFESRPKAADERAIVSLQDRIVTGVQSHEEGFSEWLRQRDQSAMVLTDKDFMKTHLFNTPELSAKNQHPGPVQHVLGAPKTDAYGNAVGGPVAVQAKAKKLSAKIQHDELLVRMLATPVDESMVFAELTKAGVCLGSTGVGRVEQVGSRIEELRNMDAVLVLPKPGRYKPQSPVGTARTLMLCKDEDVIKIPPPILEELTPEQICLMPSVVAAYIILENHATRLKPGDSILLNAAHVSATGLAIVQLCGMLKLRPLCILSLPGAPKPTVQGEYMQREAWQEAENRGVLAPTLRQQYERISEQLISMGVDEVFADAVSLLRWRDRNQRILPKVALDGLCTRDSSEQLIHCLHKEGDLVVYGYGNGTNFQLSPNLLSAWGGRMIGFNISRWLHQSSGNQKKMMNVMENIAKLIRNNKFSLDTVLYKVGEDSVADAFARAADQSDPSQVILIFPTLMEEEALANEERQREEQRSAAMREQQKKQQQEELERENLKNEWLGILFTSQSIAAMNSDGPLPIVGEATSSTTPRPGHMLVWLGDAAEDDFALLKRMQGGHWQYMVCLSWKGYSSTEGFAQLSLDTPEVLNASWYLRKQEGFENADLDSLHDVEVLGRAMVEAIEPKMGEHGLKWSNVTLGGFGKGAGVLAYAFMMKIVPEPVNALVLFQPVVLFPAFLERKGLTAKRFVSKVRHFLIWGARDKYTPAAYRQLLQQTLRKFTDIAVTADNIPEFEHIFNSAHVDQLAAVLEIVTKNR